MSHYQPAPNVYTYSQGQPQAGPSNSAPIPQYANHYPQQQQAQHPYYGGQQQIHARSQHPTGPVRPRNDPQNPLECVNDEVVSKAMRRFLSSECERQGFEASEPAALHRLELEVLTFVKALFARAKEYTELSNRTRPTPIDVLSACEEYKLDVKELHKESLTRHKKRKRMDNPPILQLPPPRQPSPEMLNSDDEFSGPSVPATLRYLPPHLPALPPKHTYLRTPAAPPKKQALPSLEKKLENAALVQNSLRSLLQATEDSNDSGDGELFGGVVNWEATRLPRKKWKLHA